MTPVGYYSPSQEDYVEIIYLLWQEAGAARIRDIALRKGVRTASVVAAMKRLATEGLVLYEAGESVSLTGKGEVLGRTMAWRHRFLRRFLMDVLLVAPDMAETEACLIEHHLCGDTLQRLMRFHAHLIASEPGVAVLEAFHQKLADARDE